MSYQSFLSDKLLESIHSVSMLDPLRLPELFEVPTLLITKQLVQLGVNPSIILRPRM